MELQQFFYLYFIPTLPSSTPPYSSTCPFFPTSLLFHYLPFFFNISLYVQHVHMYEGQHYGNHTLWLCRLGNNKMSHDIPPNILVCSDWLMVRVCKSKGWPVLIHRWGRCWIWTWQVEGPQHPHMCNKLHQHSVRGKRGRREGGEAEGGEREWEEEERTEKEEGGENEQWSTSRHTLTPSHSNLQ